MKSKLNLLTSLLLALTVVLTMIMCACNNHAAESAEPTTAKVETMSVYEKDQEIYKDLIASFPSGTAYAFVDMAEDQDALLVADQTISFEGKLEASEATVYAQDRDGKVVRMGVVESTTTSMPLVAFEHGVYYGSHKTVSKATINTNKSKMEVETAETNNDEYDVANKAYNLLFDEYGQGTVIEFTEVK